MHPISKKRARAVRDAVKNCERIPDLTWSDPAKGHTYALNAAFRCVELAIELAIDGLFIDKANLRNDLCDGEMRFSPAFEPTLRSVDDTVDGATMDAPKVQSAFQNSMSVFLSSLKQVWHQRTVSGLRMFDLFETVVKHCVTLPVGYTMVHELGFAGWASSDFDSKWSSQYGIWTTPLLTVTDANERKITESTFSPLESAEYIITVERCVPGFIDIDAFETPGGRRRGDRTAFREFAETWTNLCSTISRSDPSLIQGPSAINDGNCRMVMETVTGSNGDGRDRLFPMLLDKGFMGWILKYDWGSLERQVMIFPKARVHLSYIHRDDIFSKAAEDDMSLDIENRKIRLRALDMHLVQPAARITHPPANLLVHTSERLQVREAFTMSVMKTFEHALNLFGLDALKKIWTLPNSVVAIGKISLVFLRLSNYFPLKERFSMFGRPNSYLYYDTDYCPAMQSCIAGKLLNRHLIDLLLNDRNRNNYHALFSGFDLEFFMKSYYRPISIYSQPTRFDWNGDVTSVLEMFMHPRLGKYRLVPSANGSMALFHATKYSLDACKLLMNKSLGADGARPSDQNSISLLSAVSSVIIKLDGGHVVRTTDLSYLRREKDRIDLVKMLLDPSLGQSRARPSDRNSLALKFAVEDNSAQLVQMLLDPKLGEFQARASDAELMLAVAQANVDMVKSLLKPRRICLSSHPEIILHAIQMNSHEILTTLLDPEFGECRARPSQNDVWLAEAVKSTLRNPALAAALLDPRLGDDRARPSKYPQLLLDAVEAGHVNLVRLLLDPSLGEYRARPSERSSISLLKAVRTGNSDIVKMLLNPDLGEYRARPSDQDYALIDAVEAGNVSLVTMLLDPSLGRYRARSRLRFDRCS